MDNVKFKEAGNGWYVKIFLDETGKESSRTPSWNKKVKPGYYEEMKAWEKRGNVVEPQYTIEEWSKKKNKEKEQKLEAQKEVGVELLNKTQHKIGGDYDKQKEDVDKWLVWRAEVKSIIRSSVLRPFPPEPF